MDGYVINNGRFGIREGAMLSCLVAENETRPQAIVRLADNSGEGIKLLLEGEAFKVFVSAMLPKYMAQPRMWMALRGGKYFINKSVMVGYRIVTGAGYVEVLFAGFGVSGVCLELHDEDADEFIAAMEIQSTATEPDPLNSFLMF